MQKFSPFVPCLRRTTLLFGAASSRPPHASLPSEKTGVIGSIHTKTLTPCATRHPFINASGCLNPEIGQLCDDDAFRRWQARIISYLRDKKSSRSQTYKENCRKCSNQSRGDHQDQGQVDSHCGNHSHRRNNNSTHTPGQHGAVPPSPASLASASASVNHFGATHDPNGNPNTRQPDTFRTGN